mmetsp:Transcript_29857/g.84096  ORF Transcript_29857/g.84096 Transcript_29857/m.84096 type:complete len:351 (+) Transcript_29857:104-1156(+)
MSGELHEGEYVAKRYIIKYKAGKGKAGGVVYGVEDPKDPSGAKKVLKYPARKEEHDALSRIYYGSLGQGAGEGRPPRRPLGMSGFFDCGTYNGERFIAMEHLGRPILQVLDELKISFDARWEALRTLGRAVLRSLEAVHRAGVIHCDVQPANILMQRSGSYQAGVQWRPYLIDFGCAQCSPWTKRLRPDWGSLDYNSIHSAGEDTRGPYDDIESMGWVLCRGILGELPWFRHTKQARWKGGKLVEEQRSEVCNAVADDKAALLDRGERAFGREWKHLVLMPPDLAELLHLARAGSRTDARVADYSRLGTVLGGPDLDPEEAEQRDVEEYSRHHARCEAAMVYMENLLGDV